MEVEPEHFGTQLVATQIRQDQEFDTSPTSDFEAVTEEGTRYLEATYATDEEETKVETKEERRQRRTEGEGGNRTKEDEEEEYEETDDGSKLPWQEPKNDNATTNRTQQKAAAPQNTSNTA